MKPNKNISNQVIPRYSYLIINLTVSLFNFILLGINKNIEEKDEEKNEKIEDKIESKNDKQKIIK